MARKLIVELIADPRGYTAGLEKAARQTKTFEAEFGKMTRGVVSGTGLFHGLGRSIAFASGGFVAFAGVSSFLKDSVDAARDAGVAQRSLAAQMKASGESFIGNQAAIEKATLSLEKFGFTSEDSEHALTVLERGTGSITRAIGLQGVAANLARAKNIDLASAANILAKVFGGQETALRRAVPGLAKHEHGLQLIADAERRLSGQAGAATTQAEKFHATLHNTEVIVGTALLPTLNNFLRSLGDWLQKMNESGRLQRDVNTAMSDATAVVRTLKTVFDEFAGVVGGSKKAVELLLGTLALLKAASWASAFSGVVSGIGGIGKAAEGSMTKVELLRGGLLRLGEAGAALVVVDALVKHSQGKDAGGISAVGGAPGTEIGNTGLYYPGTRTATGLPAFNGTSAASILEAMGKTKAQSADPFADARPNPNANKPLYSAAQRNTWFDQMLQRQLGRVQDITSIRGQISRLREISAEISKRISATKDITRKLSLEDQLLSVRRQIRGDQATIADNRQQAAQAAADRKAQAQQALFDRLQFGVDKAGLTDTLSDDLAALRKYQAVLKTIIATQGSTLALQQQLLQVELNIKGVTDQITQNRKDAAAAAKAAAQQAADAAKQAAADAKTRAAAAATAAAAARDAVQFRLLGLGPTGGALVPGSAALRKRLGQITSAVKGTFLDTDKTGAQLARVGKILAGQFGAVSEQVRAAIDAMFNSIHDKLAGKVGDQTKFQHLSSQKFVDSLGLNLTGAQRRAIESRFSTVGAGGTVPPGQSHQFGGVTITGPVHVHGVQDIAGFENQIVKRAKARPHTRRGA